MGRARKSGEDANVKSARKGERDGKKGSSSCFFFRVRAFSIPRTRLSRSLEQAISENEWGKEIGQIIGEKI